MNFIYSRSGIFLLSFLSGILLSVAWPSAGFAPLLFVALIPLLLAEDVIYRNNDKFHSGLLMIFSYFTFFTFNLLTTWWVKYASFFGAVAAIVCNALFMALIFQLFHVTRKKLGVTIGYISLIVYWVAFEHIHMDWDLSWPWLTLGNGFAGWVKMIQWYEFTGVLGGTIWVWVINIFLYMALAGLIFKIKEYNYSKDLKLAAVILFIPVLYSVIRYYTYNETIDPVKVAVIQPNIDPYNEKFSGMSSADQLERILGLASRVTDSLTDYVIAPETALPDGIWEEEISEHPQIMLLQKFQETHPNADWVIGLASNKYYPDSNQRSATARKFTNSEGYYDSFNTAMQLNQNGKVQLHHKSKLVPGVEKMPFPAIFKHLDKFAIDLGGISGSLGMQEIPSVFVDEKKNTKIAPVICYESIYGDYLTQYIEQGAELIFIITNDGLWSDTPGYRQHLKYATLRAIETRRSIARSANTGISCFINQRGDILQATSWWVPAALNASINKNTERTLYSYTGDILGTIALFGSAILIGFLFVKRKSNN
ncbi:MAG TPA: apolipoprotein N-acyltransferase [Bacteroidia bacterium]|nr:apolipoprotein N-acyltransferase [Bacteroidia bacterium]